MGGGSRSKEYRTQAEAEGAARQELLAKGGGELVVKAKDGKVRDKTTVGKSDAHKSADKGAEPRKGAEAHKGAQPQESTDAPRASG